MNKLISKAKQKIGIREGSTAFIQLINEYNGIKPLPVGYKMKTSDNWCATFVSVCMKEAGVKNAPYECGAERMRQKCKPSNTPKVGYLIFYDWSGKKRRAQHVGIIESVSRGTLTVIEGNKANAVGRRTIKANSPYIMGYGVVEAEEMDEKRDLTAVAKAVIHGDYGTGETRRVMLASAGYDYRAVQAEVKRLLKVNKQ